MAERAAKTIDERFDEVTHAFLDQRDFTMFCHDKLRREIRDSEGRVTRRLESLEGRFDGLECRFDGLEGRFDGLEGRFDGLEGKVDGLEKTMDRRFSQHELLLNEILNEVKNR